MYTCTGLPDHDLSLSSMTLRSSCMEMTLQLIAVVTYLQLSSKYSIPTIDFLLLQTKFQYWRTSNLRVRISNGTSLIRLAVSTGSLAPFSLKTTMEQRSRRYRRNVVNSTGSTMRYSVGGFRVKAGSQ